MKKKTLALAYPAFLLLICCFEIPQVIKAFTTVPRTETELCISLLHVLLPLPKVIIIIWIVRLHLELLSYVLCCIISLFALVIEIALTPTITILHILYIILFLLSIALSCITLIHNRKKNVALDLAHCKINS